MNDDETIISPVEQLQQLVEGENGFKEESVIDRLRKARTEVAEQHTVDIDIPGYNGELFCKYRLLDSSDLKGISEVIRKTIRDREEQMVAAGCDTLIKACEEFWVRDKGREIAVKDLLDPPRPDFPVQYDTFLADFLGYRDKLPDPPTRRSVVMQLFGGNEIAMAAHNANLARWTMGMGIDVDNELGNF